MTVCIVVHLVRLEWYFTLSEKQNFNLNSNLSTFSQFNFSLLQERKEPIYLDFFTSECVQLPSKLWVTVCLNLFIVDIVYFRLSPSLLYFFIKFPSIILSVHLLHCLTMILVQNVNYRYVLSWHILTTLFLSYNLNPLL